jgi:hypothetical protein
MDLEGRFTSPDNLADVMRRAGSSFLSGTFTVRCAAASVASFSFYRGKMSGSDNQDRHRRLGRILLNRGLIDRATLEEALTYQADFAPGTPLGGVLVHRNKLSIDDLKEAVRIQIEDDLFAVMTCSDGLYRFEPSETGEEEPMVQLDTLTVVDEAMTRQPEWQRIREKVPNDAVIPAVIKLRGPADREILHLNTYEWHVLSLVNGYFDVGCISTRSGLGRFETYKLLDSLLTNGIVELLPPKDPVSDNDTGFGGRSHSRPNNRKVNETSSNRWGSLLSKLREENDAKPGSTMHGGPLNFESPVAFLAELSNRILLKLMVNQDFVLDPSDEKLTERYWRQVLMTFPRADLVSAEMNTLDASSFDRYTRTLGVSGPMHSIYLDTVDALTRYLRTLYLLSAQRLGTRMARTIFLDVMDDVKNRSTIANSENFFFKTLATEILA